MEEQVTVVLPSGTELKINPAPFEAALALCEAMLEEANTLGINSRVEVSDLCKQILCVGFSSKKIKAAIIRCMEKTTYGGLRITADTFEPTSARQDYFEVLYSVAKVNMDPFMKDLYAKFKIIMEKLAAVQA